MKKFVSAALAAGLMAASLSACGSAASTSTAAAPASQASSAAASTAAASQASAESDWAYVQGKGSLVVGYTIYNPMNYYDADNNFVGFDTELAQAVGEKLGIAVEFQEIEWDNKVIELDAKNIDCIWNGMTILEDLKGKLDFSVPYSGNMQSCVISTANAETYTDLDTINAEGVMVCAEAGSAGEDAAQQMLPNASLTTMTAQRDCLTELKSGTADVAVMDYVMASASVGEGTDFADLQLVEGVELSKEEYGIGFRKGSDLTELVNNALQELADEGFLAELQAKYPTVMVTLTAQ